MLTPFQHLYRSAASYSSKLAGTVLIRNRLFPDLNSQPPEFSLRILRNPSFADNHAHAHKTPPTDALNRLVGNGLDEESVIPMEGFRWVVRRLMNEGFRVDEKKDNLHMHITAIIEYEDKDSMQCPVCSNICGR